MALIKETRLELQVYDDLYHYWEPIWYGDYDPYTISKTRIMKMAKTAKKRLGKVRVVEITLKQLPIR